MVSLVADPFPAVKDSNELEDKSTATNTSIYMSEFSPGRRPSRPASSALSVLLAIESTSSRKLAEVGAKSSYGGDDDRYGSFYGSYQSVGLPEDYYTVPLPLTAAQPKALTPGPGPCAQDHFSCGELIRALLDYFRSLEAVAASPPFLGSTAGLQLDDLCLLPAEASGDVMDDLPLFSEATDLMHLGIHDFVLYNHEHDVRIAHVRIEDQDQQPQSLLPAGDEEHMHGHEEDEDEDREDSCSAGITVFRTDTDEDMAALVAAARVPAPAPAPSDKPLAPAANRLRSSSGNLVISCRRPGSQRWRVAQRLHSALVDLEHLNQDPAAAPPAAAAAAALPRRHSDRPSGMAAAADEDEQLDAYVRKWSESSAPSRQSSLNPAAYTLHNHTSLASPCFERALTNDTADLLLVADAQDPFRSFSLTKSARSSEGSGGSGGQELLIDIPYSKGRAEALQLLSGPSRRSLTADTARSSDEDEAPSVLPGPPCSSPRTPRGAQQMPSTPLTSPKSLFRRFMSGLFGAPTSPRPSTTASERDSASAAVRDSSDSRGSGSGFLSSRESLGRALAVVQNLDTGDTFPVGELLLEHSPRRPDATVSPHALFGPSPSRRIPIPLPAPR